MEAPRKSGLFTQEQEELRADVVRFLGGHASREAVRRLMETESGFDPETWMQMSERGWLGMAIPRKFGGRGGSFVELSILLEEMGKGLLPTPFFSSIILGANAILNAGSEEQKFELLPQVVQGTSRVAMAFAEPSSLQDPENVRVEARVVDGDYVVRGTKSYVIDGATATLLVVAARLEGGPVGLFLVDPEGSGVIRTAISTLDWTRKQARIEFRDAPATLLGQIERGPAAFQKTLAQGCVALCSEMVGGAQACLDMAVEYAKTRVQFGRPIGSFQAVKHMCADVLAELEPARSAAYYAAWVAADDTAELWAAASVAKASCSEAFFSAAGQNVQIHGGVGYTWEHDAHLYLKRAKSSELYLGDPVYHRERLAQSLDL